MTTLNINANFAWATASRHNLQDQASDKSADDILVTASIENRHIKNDDSRACYIKVAVKTRKGFDKIRADRVLLSISMWCCPFFEE